MERHHFLITCFPIQGHINPAIELAKRLARGGARVTFSITIRGLNKVNGSLPTLEGLSYVPFSDGHDTQDSLYSNGGDFAGYMAELRRRGSENLTKILQDFTDEGCPVTCLVYSFLLPWAAVVARDMHVPSAFLAIQSATSIAIYHRFFSVQDGAHQADVVDSSVPVKIGDLPLFYSSDWPTFLVPDSPLKPFMDPIMQEHIQELNKDPKPLVLLNTFEALEQEAIRALDNRLNAVSIGPLLPSALSDRIDPTDESFGMDLFVKTDEDHYFRWLDSKPEQSVIYISFGSVAVISKEQELEICHGLLASKRPFLWVIRSSDNEEDGIKKVLENEASNSGDDLGMIVSWCSQMLLLKHKSVGCFVTHCGWNSTLESLICGVPLIGCPQVSDQTTNAKMVEEVWGTGVRARPTGETKMIERGELEKCLDVVMEEGGRGKEIRENVAKWKRLAMEAVKEGGSTYNNLSKVLEDPMFISS